MAAAASRGLLRQATQTSRLASRSFPTTIAALSTFRAPCSLQQSAARPGTQLLRSAFVQRSQPQIVRIAAFKTSSRKDILPPPPQKIHGTANEAAPVPDPKPTEGNYHWTFERAVAILLIPVTIAPFAGASMYPVMDATLCALLVLHSHTGFQSCIIDYVPHKRFPGVRTAFEWLLRVASVVVAVGLYEFETNDVGLTEAVRKIWKA